LVQVFYWTHLLFVPFWVLLILHIDQGKFWMWIVVPGTIFAIELIIRFSQRLAGKGKTFISSVALLPSRVTHLNIKRPKDFDFQPGDYVFVNIPTIATSEWHPFTISSAPEEPGKEKNTLLKRRALFIGQSTCRLHFAPHSWSWRVDQQTLRTF
jgi:NADPH oxidase 5